MPLCEVWSLKNLGNAHQHGYLLNYYLESSCLTSPLVVKMRGKRSKQYRKLMAQFEMTFGFRGPYQVLGLSTTLPLDVLQLTLLLTVDAQIIQDTDKFKMDLVGGLERTLNGKVKSSTLSVSTVMELGLIIAFRISDYPVLYATPVSLERRPSINKRRSHPHSQDDGKTPLQPPCP